MIATGVLYAGGERTARRLPLVILTISYITALAANVLIIVVRRFFFIFLGLFQLVGSEIGLHLIFN